MLIIRNRKKLYALIALGHVIIMDPMEIVFVNAYLLILIVFAKFIHSTFGPLIKS